MRLSSRPDPTARWLGPALLGGAILVFVHFSLFLIEAHFESSMPLKNLQDLASINQAIWNTAHGDLLRASILYDGVRDHLELILFPYALVYRLGGDLQQILQIQVLLVGLGAIPIYLLGQSRGLSALESLLLASVYLLQPPMHQMMTFDYLRPDLLFHPVAATMAYGLVCEKRRVLIASVVLSLFCKESASFTLVGLGAYLVASRRDRALGIACLLLGLTWLPGAHLLLAQINGHESPTLGRGGLPDPRHLQKPFHWVLWLLLSALLLGRGRKPALAIAPHAFGLLFYRPSVRLLASPFSFTLTLALDAIARWDRPRARRAVLLAIAASFVVANQVKGVWRRVEPTEVILQANPLIEQIPPGASVCTQRPLLLKLSGRRYVYQFNRHHYFDHERQGPDYTGAEYFLIRRDTVFRKQGYRRRFEKQEDALAELDSFGLETVARSGPWWLYRRP